MIYQDTKLYCSHPECPYKDCNLNQCHYDFDDFDKNIEYVDFNCLKYLDE